MFTRGRKEIDKKVKVKLKDIKPIDAPINSRLLNLFLSVFGSDGLPVSFVMSLAPSTRIEVVHVIGKNKYSSFITRGKRFLNEGLELKAYIYPSLNESLFKLGTKTLTVSLGWDDPVVIVFQMPSALLYSPLTPVYRIAGIKYKPSFMEFYLPSNNIVYKYTRLLTENTLSYPLVHFIIDRDSGIDVSDSEYEVLAVICDSHLSTLIYAINFKMFSVFARRQLEMSGHGEGSIKISPGEQNVREHT